jgi:hypothetical protein
MRTFKCILEFVDGAKVTVKASATSPLSEVRVYYAGALDRLVDCYETASLPFLEFLLRSRANNLRARCNIRCAGNYE